VGKSGLKAIVSGFIGPDDAEPEAASSATNARRELATEVLSMLPLTSPYP